MSMAAAISGDDAKVFHWSEDPRAITCITLEGVASAGPDERRRAKFLRRRRASSVPWRGTSMEGVYGASRAVLQSIIAGIAGACASSHPKIASSLGNCCSVGVTTAAGRVAGGVFILASALGAEKQARDQRRLEYENFYLRHATRAGHTSTPFSASHDRFSAPGTASRASRDGWGPGAATFSSQNTCDPAPPALDLLPKANRRLTLDIGASVASR